MENKKIAAVIVDDEINCVELLNWLLKEYCPDVHVLKSFTDSTLALKEIPTLRPDLVFLDIDMPVINGFGLLEKLSPVNYNVIFTTAYDHYAVKAIRMSALDYLLKPVDADELIESIEKFNSKNKSVSFDQVKMLVEGVNIKNPISKRIAFYSNDGLVFIETDDLEYCESDSNYTKLKLINGQTHLISKTLKDVEELLDPSVFFRIHKSYLINLRHSQKLVDGYVIMRSGVKILVSRQRKDDFIKFFDRI